VHALYTLSRVAIFLPDLQLDDINEMSITFPLSHCKIVVRDSCALVQVLFNLLSFIIAQIDASAFYRTSAVSVSTLRRAKGNQIKKRNLYVSQMIGLTLRIT